jgi:4-diphosphocytidyl-2-C-methyl-D-erythritol kinase
VTQRIDAPAKLNLGLRVLGRRSDGYHLLQSLVTFLDLADRIETAPALSWRLRVSGAFAADLGNDDNLVLRAARLLAAEATADVAGCAALAADIALEKNIPVAAGLGGGSADAAAVLRGLNESWRLDLPEERLLFLAASLGADVPMCLTGKPAMVGGIGERIAPVPLPSLSLVIVNPGIKLATKDVFARLQPPYAAELPPLRPLRDAAAVAEFARALGNSLSEPAIALCPTLPAVLSDLAALNGCLLAQMSGSGATCFGLFADAAGAERAAMTLQAARPAWFVRACRSFESAEDY